MSPHDQTLPTIEQLLNPNQPPERIYGWLDSQLSLARHYGGLKYQGHDYQIDYAADGQPLVRVDVIKRAVIEKAKACKVAALTSNQNQGGVL
jgi:hypothetical protein